MAESTGKKLKKLRRLLGYTQKRLAEKLQISVKSIQRYENDKFPPDYHTLVELSEFFDISIDYLTGLIGLKNELDMEKWFFFKKKSFFMGTTSISL